MTAAIRSVAHTGITVADLDAAIAFWTGALGAEVERRFELHPDFAVDVVGVPEAHIRAAVVRLAGFRVELLHYVGPQQRDHLRPRPCDVGSWHLALDVDDLDAVAHACGTHGWQLAGRARVMETGPRAGTRFAYLRGPDGETLELIEAPQPR